MKKRIILTIVLFLLSCIVLTAAAQEKQAPAEIPYTIEYKTFSAALKTNLTKNVLHAAAEKNDYFPGDLDLVTNNAAIKVIPDFYTGKLHEIVFSIDTDNADLAGDALTPKYLKALITTIYTSLGLTITDEECGVYVQKAINNSFAPKYLKTLIDSMNSSLNLNLSADQADAYVRKVISDSYEADLKNAPFSLSSEVDENGANGKPRAMFDFKIKMSEKKAADLSAEADNFIGILSANAETFGLAKPAAEKNADSQNVGYAIKLNDADTLLADYNIDSARWNLKMDYKAAEGEDLSQNKDYADTIRLILKSIINAVGISEPDQRINQMVAMELQNDFSFDPVTGIDMNYQSPSQKNDLTATFACSTTKPLKKPVLTKSAFESNLQAFGKAAAIKIPEAVEKNGNYWYSFSKDLFLVAGMKEGSSDEIQILGLLMNSAKSTSPEKDVQYQRYYPVFFKSLYKMIGQDVEKSTMDMILKNISILGLDEGAFKFSYESAAGEDGSTAFASVADTDSLGFSSSDWFNKILADIPEAAAK